MSTYLADLPDWAAAVTVGDLVHHTSAIPDYTDLLADAGIGESDPTEQSDAVEVISESNLLGEPGVEFDYSNSNYVLLAEIVEAVTGERIGDFLTAEVFVPLGLDAEMSPNRSGPDVARGYANDGRWVDETSPWAQLGDGSVFTTPEQLALWGTQYWDPGLRGGELDRLRFSGAVDTGDGSRYGLGVETTGSAADQRITHSGGWGGLETDFVVAPEQQVAVAVTCNSPDLDVPENLGEQLVEAWT